MELVALIASILAGVALVVIGSGQARVALAEGAGARLARELQPRARTPLRAFGVGAALSALLPASGRLPLIVSAAMRAALLPFERASWLLAGTRTGGLFAALLVLVVAAAPPAGVLAPLLLCAAAACGLLGPRRNPLARALAGTGLLLLGIAMILPAAAALGEVHTFPRAPGGQAAQLAMWVAAGGLACLALRSEGACVIGLAAAASGGMLDVVSACAGMLGAHLASPCISLRAALGNGPASRTAQDLRLASWHGVVAAACALVGLVLLPFADTLGARFDNGSVQPVLFFAAFALAWQGAGLVLAWMIARPVQTWIEGAFLQQDGRLDSCPEPIDESLEIVPAFSLVWVLRCAERAGTTALRLARARLNQERVTDFRHANDRREVELQVQTVDAIAERLQQARLPGRTFVALLDANRTSELYIELIELLDALPAEAPEPRIDAALKLGLRNARLATLHLLSSSTPRDAYTARDEIEEQLQLVERHVEDTLEALQRSAIDQALADDEESVSSGTCREYLETLRRISWLAADAALALESVAANEGLVAAVATPSAMILSMEAVEEPDEHEGALPDEEHAHTGLDQEVAQEATIDLDEVSPALGAPAMPGQPAPGQAVPAPGQAVPEPVDERSASSFFVQ